MWSITGKSVLSLISLLTFLFSTVENHANKSKATTMGEIIIKMKHNDIDLVKKRKLSKDWSASERPPNPSQPK